MKGTLKRALWSIVVLAMLAAPDALAACQRCLGNGTQNATCWTVSPCEHAMYGACWEQQFFNPDGTLDREQCVGSAAGSDCNQNCGGGGNPGGGGGSGGGGCQWSPGGCPADCSSCDPNDV
jgi:uncharacterized membrane protein YgcG